jgi:hypothetical protein
MSVPRDLRLLLSKREIKQPIISNDLDLARKTASELAFNWKLVFAKMRECVGNGEKDYRFKKMLNVVVDPKTGTTRAGTVEFDPDNLEAELEAVRTFLPGLGQPNASEPSGDLTSKVISAYCAEREAGGNWGSKTDVPQVLRSLT